MIDSAFIVTAFATLFVVMDPPGLVPLFIALTRGMPATRRRAMARRACTIAAILLTAFAIAGDALLGFVGISIPAFRIAGGILLFLTALDMLFERRTQRREGQAAEPDHDHSVFPLATPLIAGPGAIATMMWPTVPEFGNNIYVLDKTVPMIMSNDNHEPGPKVMPDGTIINIPNGMAEVDAAVDWLFNHPNTAPFVAYRLIQRMVKSNPTPEYVQNVASKFIDNGSGVRGDMKAVIKAILLDDEARKAAGYLDEYAGKLREPFLRYTPLAKALPTVTDRGRYWNNGYNFLNATRQH